MIDQVEDLLQQWGKAYGGGLKKLGFVLSHADHIPGVIHYSADVERVESAILTLKKIEIEVVITRYALPYNNTTAAEKLKMCRASYYKHLNTIHDTLASILEIT